MSNAKQAYLKSPGKKIGHCKLKKVGQIRAGGREEAEAMEGTTADDVGPEEMEEAETVQVASEVDVT